jgi:hypothetical protein
MTLIRESSSSSSKPHHSGSGSRPRQHPAPLDLREETKNNSDSDFHPETRLETINLANLSPPSVIIAEDEKEHPLLFLHQSVSGGNSRERKGDGRGMHENTPPQPQTVQQTLQPKHDSSSDMNEKGKKRDLPRVKQKKPSTAITLVKSAVVVISLLVVWRPIINSAINNTIAENSLKLLSNLSTRLSVAQLMFVSFVDGLNRNKILSLLPSFDVRKDKIPREHLEQRMELGFDLLRKYDDASGSLAVCENVLHTVLDGRGEPHDGSETEISSMALFDVNENRLLSKAFLCIGESRLSLVSSSLVSQSDKKELLEMAKDSFKSAVSRLYS